MRQLPKNIIILADISFSLFLFFGCAHPKISTSRKQAVDNIEDQPIIHPAELGEVIYTHVYSSENGNIAVRIDIPSKPRYGETVPIVVVASTWFVEKYNNDETPFHLEFNPVSKGVLVITHLWPGKIDPESGVHSDGEYDFGGPNSLAALRDTIRFALGKTADINGNYLNDLITPTPLYDNVRVFACRCCSHKRDGILW